MHTNTMPSVRGTTRRVVVLTHIITPYQVELFDAISSNGLLDLKVIYLAASASHRQWQQQKLGHPFLELSLPGKQNQQIASEWISDADLVVFGFYQNAEVLDWLENRARQNRPWCFWGERPGFRVGGTAGILYRHWKLRPLKDSHAPIWGIGQWAIDGYVKEFGNMRPYFNIPYFSDLARFRTARSPGNREHGIRRILFSGSLIKRKGIDLLATAFRKIAQTNDHVRLDIVGDGELRNKLMRELEPVSDKVTFHGFRQWDQLPDYYAQADILCVPSRYDGWGLVVPEGLAAGLPVIATDKMGAAIDLLHDGSNGWSVTAGEYDELQDALSTALTLSDQELDRMSEAAVASVADHTIADGVHRFEQAVSATLSTWVCGRLKF